MSNYLKRFTTLQEYTNFLESDDFVTPNVSYVEELDENDNHVHITRETYKFGDILMWDNVNKFKFGATVNLYTTKFKNNSQYIPVGVCVIGTGLLDNYARFICIKGQTTKMWSTNVGATANSSTDFIYYDTTVLTNFTKIRSLGTGASVLSNSSQTSSTSRNGYARIPIERTDSNFNTVSDENSNLRWYVETDSSAYYTRSLYNQNWTLNSWHFDNLGSDDYFNDRDGYSNTDKLFTHSGVIYSGKSISFPAAEYCKTYSEYNNYGISTGRMYLPSITELSLGLCRYKSINDILLQITDAQPLVSNSYWSSTEYSAYSAARFYTNYGYIYSNYKYFAGYVRPFFRL